jgi:PAS domain S-box-containing protein
MVTNQTHNTSRTGGRRYRHLFEHAPICIFVIDLTVSPVTILEVNRRAELVYGYPAAGLIGMPAEHLVAEEAMQQAQTIVQQVHQGQTVTAETTHRRRDGTQFPVRVIATLDPTDDSHMIVTVEDITAERQRRSEAEAIASERLRIAHEIHDGVAQTLAGLRFKSALWSHLADEAPPNMRAALDELQIILANAIEDLRRAIFALRPLDLKALGFFPALTQLVDDFGDQNRLVTLLELSGPEDDLPAVYELPLFRIIQEGLNNIGQHARAKSVQLRLTVNAADGVVISLRDDGCGFDLQQLGGGEPNGRFGLRQMRERILALGGTLDIHSTLGQGTELLITLPPLAKEVNHAPH